MRSTCASPGSAAENGPGKTETTETETGETEICNAAVWFSQSGAEPLARYCSGACDGAGARRRVLCRAAQGDRVDRPRLPGQEPGRDARSARSREGKNQQRRAGAA